MFKGSIAALITPFLPSHEIDFAAFRSLIGWHLQEKTDALVICGTTGESWALSAEEQLALLEIAVLEAKGRIPIIMGTGHSSTKETLSMTEMAKNRGADGCLVVFPYYNRPTFEGCSVHFQRVAEVGLPVIAYYHPGRTGVKLTPRQLAEIAEIKGVVNIKDASGDVEFSTELMRYTSTPVLSGDDTLTLPLAALGAKGVISIAANVIPGQWREYVNEACFGDMKKARDLHYKYLRLCKALVLETNPQGVKYALSLLKKCEAVYRLPLIEPKPLVKEEIAKSIHSILWEPKEDPIVILDHTCKIS